MFAALLSLYNIVNRHWLLCRGLKVDSKKKVMMVLWDTAGQEDYDRLRPLCYQRTNAVIVCFSVNERNSYVNVEAKWIPEIRHHCPDVPVILVATKTDLRLKYGAGRCLTTKDGNDMAQRLSVDAYYECSSKTGDGVADVFQLAACEATRDKRHGNRRLNCDLF